MSASTAPTRRITAASLGKIPTTRARRLISLLTRSSGLVDQIFDQWARGNAVNARTSALAWSISGPILGKDLVSWSRTSSQVAATVVASGWAKMVRNTAATMPMTVGVGLGDQGQQVAGEVDAAALVRGALEGPLEGGDEAGVLVGDHQPHSAESTLLQVGEEGPPEHLVLTVADVETEDLTSAVDGDPGRDHHGHRHHLGGGVADMEVGGVEVDVGERGVVQP